MPRLIFHSQACTDSNQGHIHNLLHHSCSFPIDNPHHISNFHSLMYDKIGQNYKTHHHMRFCQNYRTYYCNHRHKCHSPIFPGHKCLFQHMSRNRSVRNQGCTSVNCMLHHTLHHLAMISNNQDRR